MESQVPLYLIAELPIPPGYWGDNPACRSQLLDQRTEHRIGSWQIQDSLPRHGSALLPRVYGSPKQASILGTH